MTINIHVMTSSLIVIHNDTTVIQSSDPRYAEILKTLSSGMDEEALKDILFFNDTEPKQVPPSADDYFASLAGGCPFEPDVIFPISRKDIEGDRLEVDLKNGKLLIDKNEMPEALQKKFLDLKRRHKPRSYLIKFWDKLQSNPSQNSIKMLYKFLEHNGHPIMADGNFIAYKAVTMDLMDHHTKTNKHKIGCVVKMDRKDVNADPHALCSAGLHIASWEYLKDFNSDCSRYLEVLVDPKDVVAVPNDYNGTKCRVSRYKVYREVTKERTEKKKK